MSFHAVALPLALLIGGALFIYRHREQWRRENSD